MNTNLSLSHTQQSLSLIPIDQVVVDPREQIITGLEEQNQDLLQVIEKAADVFQKNKEEKDLTIASLSKSNEELSAALIASESRNKELVLLYEAAIKGLQDQHNQQKAILENETQKILTLCESITPNQNTCKLSCCVNMFNQMHLFPRISPHEWVDEFRNGSREQAEANAREAAKVDLIKSHLETMKQELKNQ